MPFINKIRFSLLRQLEMLIALNRNIPFFFFLVEFQKLNLRYSILARKQT